MALPLSVSRGCRLPGRGGRAAEPSRASRTFTLASTCWRASWIRRRAPQSVAGGWTAPRRRRGSRRSTWVTSVRQVLLHQQGVPPPADPDVEGVFGRRPLRRRRTAAGRRWRRGRARRDSSRSTCRMCPASRSGSPAASRAQPGRPAARRARRPAVSGSTPRAAERRLDLVHRHGTQGHLAAARGDGGEHLGGVVGGQEQRPCPPGAPPASSAGRWRRRRSSPPPR